MRKLNLATELYGIVDEVVIVSPSTVIHYEDGGRASMNPYGSCLLPLLLDSDSSYCSE